MKIHSLPGGDSVHRYKKSIVVTFTGERHVISTGPNNGGYREDLQAVFNLDSHFYANLPGRESIIAEIENNIVITEEDGVTLYNTASEKGVRYFMDTGIIATYPFPIYEPFSMKERILLLDRMIQSIRKGICHLTFHKNQVINNLPLIQLELHEAENHANADLYIIQNDLKVHKMYFFNAQILESVRDFFDIVVHPRYCKTEQESLALLEKIRDEYAILMTCFYQ